MNEAWLNHHRISDYYFGMRLARIHPCLADLNHQVHLKTSPM